MRQAVTGQIDALYSVIANGVPEPPVADFLFETAAAFDMKSASLFLMPSKTDSALTDLILVSSMPQDFWRRIDETSPLSTCQLFHAARSSLVPVKWSVEGLRQQNRLVNLAEPPALAVYEEFGIGHGIVFPMSSIDGMRHAVRFDGGRPPLTQAEINDLAMLAAHFFQAYDRSRYPLGDPTGLTERELEVVQWSATGKTSSEIATIMSLSDHTINAYMNNALRKLGCTSRTQLVAKALRMRIIS